jgi:hypothetical protein
MNEKVVKYGTVADCRIDTVGNSLLTCNMTLRGSTAVQLTAFAAFIAVTIVVILTSLTFIADQCASGTPLLPAIFPCFAGG